MKTHDSTAVLVSHIGADSELEAHVGVEAVQPITATSSFGMGPRGPKGDQGNASMVPGPQGDKGDKGDQGIVGPRGGTPIILVAAAEWPPSNPITNTLYLKGA